MTRQCATAKVTFHLSFTPNEVRLLASAASHHYDAVCRWFEPVRRLEQWLDAGASTLPAVEMSWHDLDILSKICESPMVPPELAQAVYEQFAVLRQATDHATVALKSEGFETTFA